MSADCAIALAEPRKTGSQSLHRHDENRAVAVAVLAAATLAITFQLSLVLLGAIPVLDGLLIDPDAYLRLSRVAQLWQTGEWYDPTVSRIGQEGLALHWTRPLDLLLLVGAWLASPFLGFERALFWWGAFSSPVLYVIAIFAFTWAAAPLLRQAWLIWAPFLFVTQPAVFIAFVAGRPDHQALLALLSVLVIGFTLRALLEPQRTGAAIALGVVGALAIWVSIEAIVVVTVSIAALGVSWLSGVRQCARMLSVYAATLLYTLTAALLVERGLGGLLQQEVDRLSNAHLALFTVNLAFWATVDHYERRGIFTRGFRWRAGLSLLGVAAAVATVWSLNPEFFSNPLLSGDSLYKEKHLPYIEELQPLVPFGEAGFGATGLGDALLWVGIALPAIPALLYLLATARGAHRYAWGYVALGVLVTLPLAIGQRRWSFYPEAYLLLPYVALSGWLVHRLAQSVRPAVRLARLPLICALCAWVYVPAAVSNVYADRDLDTGVAGGGASCPINEVAPVLNDPAGLGSSSKRILAFIDVGPEILYRTPHSVFSIPNHRLQPGFATSYRIMTARDLTSARRLLDDAGVDLIMICPASPEAWFYATADGTPTLHSLLSEGRPPPFLAEVPLPQEIRGKVMLYQMRGVGDEEAVRPN